MTHTSPLDGVRTHIEQWLAAGKSHAEVAYLASQELALPTSERSVRRAVRRWGGKKENPRPRFDKPGFRLHGDAAEIVSDPRVAQHTLNDADSLMRERGLDPAEWEVESLVVNEWGPPGEELKQLKLRCKRKRPLTLPTPARVSLSRTFPNLQHQPVEDEAELVVVCSDHHAPNHDPELHKRFCEFLHAQVPERGIFMGDLLDLPQDSRHPAEPDWDAATQACLDAGSQIMLDCRGASPNTFWVMLPGNHTERLRRIVIDRLGHWYGLTPAKVAALPDLPPIHDPVHLLRMDEIGVEYLRPKGNYKYAEYMVSPYLAATHGDKARRGSGTSALATLDGLDYSIVVGHTHRQSLVQKTVTQIDRTGRLLQAAEAGCMCRIQHGLGYLPRPDWSNGFLTASIWPDGTFKLDLATYVDNRLYWRSERY